MKLIPTLATLCVLVLPCALPAETFEGKVSMKVTAPNAKEGPSTMNFSMKEGFVRMDMSSGRGAVSMITDIKNQQIIMLMAEQRMYMVRPIPQPSGAPRPEGGGHRSELEDTGVKETILGYVCSKYVVKDADSTTEIWVTDQLGTFMGLSRGGGPGRPPQAPQAWESAMKGHNFFPMRVVSNKGGGEKFRLEVTSVEKTSLPDSLFTAPDGWRKFDMGALMGGAFPGGYPGGRPSDGNN